MSLTLHTLGRLEVRWNGQAVPQLKLRKSQALLVYLALNPGRHDRSRLAGLLWGDLAEENARRNLRHALHQLRRTLDPEILDSDRLAVGLNPDLPLLADVTAFETAIARAGQCRRADEWAAAAEHLEAAIALYDGDFMDHFDVYGCREFEEWVAAHRARIREQAMETLDTLATYWMRHGAHERGLQHTRRLLNLEPLWERSHRQMMRLLALTGKRSAALIQYEQCRRLLRSELGVEPLEETTELYERIRASTDERVGNWGIEELGSVTIPISQFPDSPTLQLPFVGREDEHASLICCWETAVRGSGQLVLVEGEAGVGKTRLIEEVLRYVRTQGAVILSGRCYEFGGGLPYQPIAEALYACDALAGTSASDQHGSGLSPIWLAELSRLLPDLHHVVSDLPSLQPIPGEAARHRLFEAVARFMRAACPPRSGICLFLDDLHWADQSTLDLFHYLVRWLVDAPVWLVGTYRPEEVDLGHPLTRLRQGLSRDGMVTHLALERLSGESVRALGRSLVGEQGGGALGDVIYRESDGNAFILSEIVSGLQERGLLSREGAAIERWTALPSAERVTPRVHDMILQRVGRLPRPSRQLLGLAATAGHQFDHLLLQTAARLDAARVDECLDQWLTRRLVQPVSARSRSRPAVPSSATYDFAHDKIRTAVYHSLSTAERQQQHGAIGEALEAIHRDHLAIVYEALAYHFERAGLVEQALTYLPLAAAKAAAVYANEQALDYYRRAFALCPTFDERRWHLLLSQAEILRLMGRYDEAAAALTAVIDGGEPELQVRAYNNLAQVHRLRRDYAAARRCAHEGERLAHIAHGSEAPLPACQQARTLQTLGEIEREQSNFERATQLFEAALVRYEQIGDARGQSRCLKGLADTLCAGGHYAQARRRYEQAVALFRSVGDKPEASTCLRGIAVASWRQGDYAASRRATIESLEISRAIDDRQGEAGALNNLGLLALVSGDHDETQRHLEHSVAIFRELGIEKRAAAGLHNLGISYLECGRLATARACLEQALEINRAVGARRDQALDLGWLGQVQWRLQDHAAALRCLDDALALDEEIGGGEEQDWHLLWRAAIACERGDVSGAGHYLQQAEQVAARGRSNIKYYEIAQWKARICLTEGDFQAARQTAGQALVSAEENGARPGALGQIHALLGRALGSGPSPDDEQARCHFERALALLADDVPTMHARAMALSCYAHYLADRNQHDAACACSSQAEAILQRMGVPAAREHPPS